MAPDRSASALKHKLKATQDPAPRGARGVLRALRLALARAAADAFGLALAVIGATQARAAQDRLGKFLNDERMLVLLDGPGGQLGAIGLDRACLGALIQQQTMGKVSGAAPSERAFTGTDAAMAAPLIDAMLEHAAELADLPEDRRCLRGYRYGARAEDLRRLLLALDRDRYRVFDLTVEFCGGAQQGAVCLVLPELPEETAQAREDAAADPRLKRALGWARADLTAVICRLRVPLSDLAAMVPGDVLPLTRHRLNETDLIGITGERIATGRLGQIGGSRAIRLNETEAGPPAGVPDLDANREPAVDPGNGPAGAEGFSARVTPMPPDLPGSQVAEERIVAETPGAAGRVALPAVVEAEAEAKFLALSPEAAAAEISELAGLSLQDASDAQAKGVD
jgi:flagellar motor switch protein FliM